MAGVARHKCPRTDDDGRPLAPDMVTCGICNRSWCERCDGAPSALCHYCHGRGHSTAPIPPRQAREAELWDHLADDRDHDELLRHLTHEHSVNDRDLAILRLISLESLERQHVIEHAAEHPDGLAHDEDSDGTCSDTCVALHPDHIGSRGEDGT